MNPRADIVVFIGPTLSSQEAGLTLDACYLPPARQGDIYSVVRRLRPRIIGLVDGEFLQELSVWHQEILFALERDIAVYGSSSMGALRAAELERWGMIGVGSVFEQYRDGRLCDDDEVALVHGPAETGFKPLSLPMVNIRATLHNACAAGTTDARAAATCASIAKSLHFPERTVAAIAEAAHRKGRVDPGLEACVLALREQYVDVKRQDAIELLGRIANDPRKVGDDPDPCADATGTRRMLAEQECRVTTGRAFVSLRKIVKFASLNRADFDELNRDSINWQLVCLLADVLGLKAEDSLVSVEMARLRRRLGIEEPRALDQWLDANDMEMPEFRAMCQEAALVRRMQHWFLARQGYLENTRAVLDTLRRRDEYEVWKRKAENQQDILDRHGGMSGTGIPSIGQLVNWHASRSDWQPDTGLDDWCEEAGFEGIGDLQMELEDAWRARYAVEQLAQSLFSE